MEHLWRIWRNSVLEYLTVSSNWFSVESSCFALRTCWCRYRIRIPAYFLQKEQRNPVKKAVVACISSYILQLELRRVCILYWGAVSSKRFHCVQTVTPYMAIGWQSRAAVLQQFTWIIGDDFNIHRRYWYRLILGCIGRYRVAYTSIVLSLPTF